MRNPLTFAVAALFCACGTGQPRNSPGMGGPGPALSGGKPDEPGECAGLSPPAPGPAQGRYATAVDHSKGDGCLGGLSDGAGVIALPITDTSQSFAAGNHETAVHFVTPTGSLKALSGGPYAVVTDQLSGFLGYIVDKSHDTGWFLQRWDGQGLAVGRTEPMPSTNRIIANPLGGAVVWTLERGQQIQSYDENLKLWWRAALGGWGPAALAVDRAGRTLALFDSDPNKGAWKAVDGQWFDLDGTPGPIFRVLGPQSDWAHDLDVKLAQRVGSGFFLAVSGTWVAEIDSLATSVMDAPPWLRDRRNTRLHMIHGGRGYAVLPEVGVDPSVDCAHHVEVVAPSGTSCGTAVFSAGSGACQMQEITVGHDGTVIQQFPYTSERQCSTASCTCTWQWWPGFFR